MPSSNSDAGKADPVVGAIQDVSERELAQRAVQANEAMLTAIFQSAPIAILLLDQERRVQLMNGAARAVLGGCGGDGDAVEIGFAIRCIRARDARQGCGCSASCADCPIRRAISATFETGQPQSDVEIVMCIRSDPKPKETMFRVSTSLIRLPLSCHVLMCIEDITARKRAEQDLQLAFTEIERLKNRLERENMSLREEVQLRHQHEEIVGNSAAIRAVMAQVEQVADTPAAVLLMGETGTGKELFARAVHKLSPRKDAAMVAVNCAALPATLMESELFGREAGAYTGALSKQIGRFEMADGSTLFLDEIGELSLELQAKLLRILQDGQFERLGSSKTISVDVRIVAATNRDLTQAIKEGVFREDLFHRLNVFPIAIPPLRERTEDIPLLVWAFVKELGARMGKAVDAVPRRIMEDMQRYPWPGNVRELRNVVERAMILSKGPTLQAEVPHVAGVSSALCNTLADVEMQHILQVLNATGWRVRGKNGAAEILDIKPTTLESRMARLGIKRGA